MPPGTPHPALSIWIFGGWTTPTASGPVIDDHIPCQYANAMDIGAAARVTGLPGTFHFDDVNLQVPWAGLVIQG